MIAPATPRSVALTTHSAEETRELGGRLAGVARPGDRLALVGPLGAGKTQFAKGFAAGLGVSEVVNSPSFTLMAEYAGRLPLFHLDLYRLAGAEEVLAGGLFDERQADGVTLIEWAERLDAAIDPERLVVRLEPLGGDQRRVTLEAASPRYAAYLEAAGAARR
ncbi:MAG TPA: tRNA (adenosine(37)-N6)-threonylcarbamoyltransferase complex ATPase subunit type 1 TsaE [Candidatus Limnocylindrales bacterium]|nr:tRNA (adenosine(37)-N6)-threonylcarbamoyltransferase complex ATPase subunit type 1 TsaE [Candidatus Limnocylindrales bacterium]